MAATQATASAQHEAEHVLAAHVPQGLNFQVAAKAGFDWKTLFALVIQYGPIVFQIIMDIINKVPRAALLEKYGPALHAVIDAVLAHYKG